MKTLTEMLRIIRVIRYTKEGHSPSEKLEVKQRTCKIPATHVLTGVSYELLFKTTILPT